MKLNFMCMLNVFFFPKTGSMYAPVMLFYLQVVTLAGSAVGETVAVREKRSN